MILDKKTPVEYEAFIVEGEDADRVAAILFEPKEKSEEAEKEKARLKELYQQMKKSGHI